MQQLMRSLLFFISIFGGFLCVDAAEKPIVVIIPSYNNSQWYKKNLDSVFMQRYENYRIVYIDDCSPDGTGALVREYLAAAGQEDRVWLQCNDERIGALANIYHAVHRCHPEDIVVTLDGDDWLADDKVLQRVNEAYADSHVWITYGQYQEYPSLKTGSSRQIPAQISQLNAYREYDWVSSHLRTFYAGLFQQIKLSDLLYKNSFFQVTWDMAFMFPMLEMAARNNKCITDVQYIYNQANVLNDFKQKLLEQIHCDHYIRSRQKYQPLASYNPEYQQPVVRIIVSLDDLHGCATLLQEINQYFSHVDGVDVIYPAQSDVAPLVNELLCLSYDFPVRFHAHASHEFVSTLSAVVERSDSTHCLFLDARLAGEFSIDLLLCAHAMERTGAHGFYCAFDMSKSAIEKKPAFVAVTDEIDAWQFCCGEQQWRMPYRACALYRTEHIKNMISRVEVNSLRALFEYLNGMQFDMHAVGLCFKQ